MRFPTITPESLKSPRCVYLKGAEARMSANDEPEFSERELLAADRARNKDKSERWHATNDAQAMEMQLHQMRVEGWL